MAKKPVETADGEQEAHDFTPVIEQGKQARELGLAAEACPYAEGDNRAAWFQGYEA